ncbi:MAG: trigger factor [Gammaproteobacteria bacterium]|nr:trigger factor [Gammaproteobacteria bacterium]
MKLDIKKDSDCSRTLSILMKWDEIQDDYIKEFNKVKSNYTPPGGRKGKVYGRDLDIFKKNMTPNIEAQFVDYAINAYYKKALEELKINPVNQGKVLKLDFHEGSDLKFEINFEIKPDFKLPNYKKKNKINTNKYIANSIDVADSLSNFQSQHAKSKSVEGKIKDGHFIYADFNKLDNDNNIVENSTIKNHYVRIGEGLFVDKLAKQFIGKKINDSVDTEIQQDSGPVKYRVVINKIEEQVLPEINDDFAITVDPDVKTLKELEEKILLNIQSNLNNENKKEFDNKIIEYFLEKAKFDVPDSMIENYSKHLNEQYKEQYTKQGQPYDENMFKEEIKKTSSKTVKWHMLRSEIIKAENLKISADEVDNSIKDVISKNPQHEEEIKKHYSDRNNLFNLHEEIMNKKLFELLESYFINKVKEISTDKIRKDKKGKKS